MRTAREPSTEKMPPPLLPPATSPNAEAISTPEPPATERFSDSGGLLRRFRVDDVDRFAVHELGGVHDRFRQRWVRVDRQADVLDRRAHLERDHTFADQRRSEERR